jgi:hypothetical protein
VFQELDENERLSKALMQAMIMQQTEQMWEEWEKQVPNYSVPDGQLCRCCHYEGEHMTSEYYNPAEGPYDSDSVGYRMECTLPGCTCKNFIPIG